MLLQELVLKSLCGGALVLLFAAFSRTLSPKRFAGVFAAAPTVALASLTVTVAFEGPTLASRECAGMLAGAAGFVVYCLLAPSAVRRLGTLRGSAVDLLAWFATVASLVPAVLSVPVAKAAVLTLPRWANSAAVRPRLGFEARKFTEIKPAEIGIRFAFGAGTSLTGGIVGATAGPAIGGTFLAFPAILLASLTLVAKSEGQAAARDEARGATGGAIGLVAFAAIGARLFGSAPTGTVFGVAIATWTVVGFLSYGIAWLTHHGADEPTDS